MSYNPSTDFPALVRQTSGGARLLEMPGLDFVVQALARAGLCTVSVGATMPTTNQATTLWFRPSSPSWVAEGTVFLWNAATATYQVATPLLWQAFLGNTITGTYQFFSAPASSNIIPAGTTLAAIQRAAPATTSMTLPILANQFSSGAKPIQIADFSSSVANHVITIVTPDGATIMRQSTLELVSTAVELANVTLQPSPDLNAWVIL